MKIIIRGAGDIATGVALKLHNVGFDVLMLETSKPTTVRRTVAFSEAVFDKKMEVEGVTAVLAKDLEDAFDILQKNQIPVLVDETCQCIEKFKPDALVDAIIAKKNIGTKITDAPIVIGLGPGFHAPVNCHCVIETNRGHDLARLIYNGLPQPNTGVPSDIDGQSEKRIIRAPKDGIIKPVSKIGDIVKKDDIIAYVDDEPIYALIDGMIRGMLYDGLYVKKGMKSGDIDPRGVKANFKTASDKARAIGGGVLEAILHLRREINE